MFVERGIQKLSKIFLLAIKEIHKSGRFSTSLSRNPLTRTLSGFINMFIKDIHSVYSLVCRRILDIHLTLSKHLYMNVFNEIFTKVTPFNCYCQIVFVRAFQHANVKNWGIVLNRLYLLKCDFFTPWNFNISHFFLQRISGANFGSLSKRKNWKTKTTIALFLIDRGEKKNAKRKSADGRLLS